ncbi:prephenate dehydrogenase/arogenate dehydrogenase family protein [Sagittula sp. NFXS13]|uniref:prephenate dehydrogenase/arogenate dehydrogenase family protein n=1 Tax=Sagittula sp. NFXS13 TaxID=2819095 RepID=UPI0032E01F26
MFVGIIGMGAFGELIARHIVGDITVWVYDPKLMIGMERRGVLSTTLERVAGCVVVVITTPVSSFEAVLRDIGNVCKPGALIVDVGSGKTIPARLMPKNVRIIATHPLFGPQSALGGLFWMPIDADSAPECRKSVNSER